MPKTGNHVYYAVEANEIVVLSVWGAVTIALALLEGCPRGKGWAAEQGYRRSEPIVAALDRYHREHGVGPPEIDRRIEAAAVGAGLTAGDDALDDGRVGGGHRLVLFGDSALLSPCSPRDHQSAVALVVGIRA
jgi:hypothetical protein